MWLMCSQFIVLHKNKFPPLLAVILLFENITHIKHIHILCYTKSNKYKLVFSYILILCEDRKKEWFNLEDIWLIICSVPEENCFRYRWQCCVSTWLVFLFRVGWEPGMKALLLNYIYVSVFCFFWEVFLCVLELSICNQCCHEHSMAGYTLNISGNYWTLSY